MYRSGSGFEIDASSAVPNKPAAVNPAASAAMLIRTASANLEVDGFSGPC